MTSAVSLAEVHRGPFLECVHHGHAVICDDSGQIVEAWGDPSTVVLPRSSSKMIQALPLLTSGAADAAGLGTEHLALSCASHNGAAIHTKRVERWLADLGMGEADLRCGSHEPKDRDELERLIRADEAPCQIHNNCSGKHSGFLTLNRHLRGGSEYIDPDHPVQKAALAAFEETTGETSPGFGIDGCSAPNFATSLHGMARAMAWFASAQERSDSQSKAAVRLVEAMTRHPELVAGEGRACTEMMRAMDGRVALKTGAEAFFIAIVPEKRMGIALKVMDGGTRAAECAIAALLVRMGVADAAHPAIAARLHAPLVNCRGIEAATVHPAAALTA